MLPSYDINSGDKQLQVRIMARKEQKTTGARDIFISYSTTDAPFVESFAKRPQSGA